MPGLSKELGTLEVRDAAGWRSWLRDNHLTKDGIWLIFRKGGKSLTYCEAVDEALAYGWIDSIIRNIDARRYVRKFTPRRPWSVWSKLNIERVEKLNVEGRMTEWGLNAFNKRTSETSLLEKFNEKPLRVPRDLTEALRANRKRRIAEAVDLISQNVKNLLK